MTCERCGRLAVEGTKLCTAHLSMEEAVRRDAARFCGPDALKLFATDEEGASPRVEDVKP